MIVAATHVPRMVSAIACGGPSVCAGWPIRPQVDQNQSRVNANQVKFSPRVQAA